MTIAEKVGNVNGAIQAFVQKGLETAETFCGLVGDLPVDVARDKLGLDKPRADLIKDTNRRMARHLYGAIASVSGSVGDLIVTQVGEAEALLRNWNGGAADVAPQRDAPAAKKTAVKKAAKKKSPARKKTKKKAAKKKTARKKASTRSGRPAKKK